VLADPHERLISRVLGSGAINVDETGWFLAGENRWMWTAATSNGAVFRIAEDRHSDRLHELLGPDFEGIVTSDRWWAYDLLGPEQRQACWSHLVRCLCWRLGRQRRPEGAPLRLGPTAVRCGQGLGGPDCRCLEAGARIGGMSVEDAAVSAGAGPGEAVAREGLC